MVTDSFCKVICSGQSLDLQYTFFLKAKMTMNHHSDIWMNQWVCENLWGKRSESSAHSARKKQNFIRNQWSKILIYLALWSLCLTYVLITKITLNHFKTFREFRGCDDYENYSTFNFQLLYCIQINWHNVNAYFFNNWVFYFSLFFFLKQKSTHLSWMLFNRFLHRWRT